jgi:2-dehydro-3-deoxyphosphogluconate aldolase/(4S)-4-hydroxy-2-oxoglutarate aldolase
MTLLESLARHQLMVAVRTDTAEKAFNVAGACIKGGVKFVEITFSVPGADEVIREITSAWGIAVGAGTVLSVPDAKKALSAGAEYIVSPNFDEDVVKFTKKEGAIAIPGACTPTEIYRAHRAGADVIKLFPFVEVGGLDFLKAIRGPFPFIKYLLCGGANLDNIAQYIAAQPAGVLVGSAIIKRNLVSAGDWAAITDLARRFVQKTESGVAGKN